MAEGTPLTPEQFVAQWQGAMHKLEVGLHNMETLILKDLKEEFQRNFTRKRFGASGEKWKPWCPDWARQVRTKNKLRKKNQHTLLVETEALRDSITYRASRAGLGVKTRRSSVYTNPAVFKRHTRHEGFDVSGIHNFGEGHIPQRQFMGHNAATMEIIDFRSHSFWMNYPSLL